MLDPDNPDHYFPLMERNFTKVNRADGNLEHIYPAFRFWWNLPFLTDKSTFFVITVDFKVIIDTFGGCGFFIFCGSLIKLLVQALDFQSTYLFINWILLIDIGSRTHFVCNKKDLRGYKIILLTFTNMSTADDHLKNICRLSMKLKPIQKRHNLLMSTINYSKHSTNHSLSKKKWRS